jgi:hypothetical protein
MANQRYLVMVKPPAEPFRQRGRVDRTNDGSPGRGWDQASEEVGSRVIDAVPSDMGQAVGRGGVAEYRWTMQPTGVR